MKIKNFKNVLFLVLGIVITLAIYIWFVKSPYFADFNAWVQANKVKFIVFLLLFKIASVIWPPITGGTLTLASIPLLGWYVSYAVDFTGSILGGIVTYHLGKKYGYAIMRKLFDESVIRKVRKVKVKKGREIEAIFVYRVLFGFTILEAVYYGAGLLKVRFVNFLVGAILSHMVVGIPIYFLVRNVLESRNILISVLSLAVAIPFFIKYRKRYFE